MILQFLCKNCKQDVALFIKKIGYLKPIHDPSLDRYNSKISDKLNRVLFKRINYMHKKVSEFYE
jgi:hypothetical protein